ncbi:MAG TPA: ferrous iron transporter B [Burkholderiaceae bacterium]|nr:ferrous iron transporter B [Burkholderiaceae bacterium]HMX09584.1 ferrous iron transporter B [Burkholderiaceae bacterium]HNB44941.1 ferrous iron transporter B [Burkholderiaceae bacterium]HNG78737.1 ferrous iron transporter B [Burkholderiaceae bacterium]
MNAALHIGAAEAGRIALVGNPNCGKTALFNRLTGSRQKVANYTGVTVERKEGRFFGPSGRRWRVLDLPGTYSLQPKSPDEAVTRAVCLGELPGEAPPDVLVCVVSATNLRLHLRFALEVRALGRPMVLVLNMMDDAVRCGVTIDRARLEAELGVPVVEAVAIQAHGAQALVDLLDGGAIEAPRAATPADLHVETDRLLDAAATGVDGDLASDWTERIDRLLLHPVAGLLILALLLFLMFQAVFTWAKPVMEAIQGAVTLLGDQATLALPPGPLRGLLTSGVIAGAGSVLAFLPQILILFFFILVLEESGYLPRAAFLLDRLMVGAGLSGRSFIPLLSSFACAVPGIMATRSIQHPRDRLLTIMVAPLMTCSARLPVYALLIAAFVPAREVGGLFNLQGLVLFALYALGIGTAVLIAWSAKRWGGPAGEHPLLLELPSYRWPHPRDLALGLWERAQIFIRRVGTVIVALTVLLWGLSSFPAPPPGATEPAIYHSAAGWIGRGLAWIFSPIGFNWQICIALVPGLAAREVVVGALATVYALSAGDTGSAAEALTPLIGAQWGLPTALSLLVWYVYAPQCFATQAVIRRETNSARMATMAAGYQLVLAYGAAFLTYNLARALA